MCIVHFLLTITSNAGVVYNEHTNVYFVFFKRILNMSLVLDISKQFIDGYTKYLMLRKKKKNEKSGVFNKHGSFV